MKDVKGLQLLSKNIAVKSDLNRCARIWEEAPIALYNTEKKEVIGVFYSVKLTAKYLWLGIKYKGMEGRGGEQHVKRSLNEKYNIHDSRFPFPVAVRYAKPELVNQLGNNKFLVLNDYPVVLEWLL